MPRHDASVRSDRTLPSNVTQTGLALSWNASSDNVGVTGYDVYRGGTKVATVNSLSSNQSGLVCGTSYVFVVRALDAAGNASQQAQATFSTAACSSAPPPPSSPPAGVVELPSSVSAAQFQSSVSSAPAGPITVRPQAGLQSFTVTGDVVLNRAQVTIERGSFRVIQFQSGSSGSTLQDCSARAAHIDGASNITWQRCSFDGQGLVGQNFIFRAPGFRFLNNTFANYHVTADESQHSEALYVGADSSGGLIEGNYFHDNGTTAHIFFTWWDGSAGVDHPRNVCVKNNRFERSRNGYTSVGVREEIPASANIDIDPTSNTWDTPMLIGNEYGTSPEFVASC